MARYTGPKARVNRRFGAQLFESAGAVRAYEKRSEQPPGMHPKSRRTSNYGTALSEKQKIKYYYGLGERQLRRYFADAVRKKGNTGETLLLICERRLDNVVRRVGFSKTRPQARQGIVHGHFKVNGVKVTSRRICYDQVTSWKFAATKRFVTCIEVSSPTIHQFLWIG